MQVEHNNNNNAISTAILDEVDPSFLDEVDPSFFNEVDPSFFNEPIETDLAKVVATVEDKPSKKDATVFDTKNQDDWKGLFNSEGIRKQSDLSPQKTELMRQKWLKLMGAKFRKQKRGITKSSHNASAKKSKRKAQKLARKKNR